MSTEAPLSPNRFERVPVTVFPDRGAAARMVARQVAELIRVRQHEGRAVVLGLATGSTPVVFYAELVRLHVEEHLSFANVVTFNLDEYFGLPPQHPQSYHTFMRMHLFDRINIASANIHVPDGTVTRADADAYCRAYDDRIRAGGGIDLQILGIGRTGHIGFNEPGSARRSRTRLVTLDPLTRRDAAGDFGGEDQTPRYAITMGVRTIMEARQVILMAWGEHKADIVCTAVEGEITSQVTASFLQEHDHAQFILDREAAGALTRYRTPWLLGALEDQGLGWDERMTRRAILWLAKRHSKPILRLTDEDYNEAGLQDLRQVYGSAYDANLAGFYQMQHTITGWPGGRDPARTKPGDAAVRPLRSPSAAVFPKRVLVLSPHPDDDVISMGGTLCRLIEHGHEVHIAYQVSGANAVSDESLWRALLFGRDISPPDGYPAREVTELTAKFECDGSIPVTAQTTRWKALIRRHEATAAARVCGIPALQLRFLDLPFYYSGPARSRRLGNADVECVHSLLSALQPHMIFVAGDLDDPHGTHRLCLQVLREALAKSTAETWFGQMELWFYRGAWAEWELDEIDMAVPLSPQEVLRRRRAIFRHETQRDRALFLGDDRREFWQRTEDRSRRLADAYNALGLAEYEAIEAFRRFSPHAILHELPM